MAEKNYILNQATAAQKLQRLALEVAEQLQGDDTDLIIIGIRHSGLVIAEKIGELLKQHIPNPINIIAASLDKQKPSAVSLSEQIDFNEKHVLLCDDVANSGRTMLYALQPLLAFHPKTIQTLVLVERMHKQFPIKPDYVGLSIATTVQEHIEVEIEDGAVSGAYIK
jgi:pyrimidine operon attenuation protein/uracil phosphoribosyltransferase